jgi:hypothetical protein
MPLAALKRFPKRWTLRPILVSIALACAFLTPGLNATRQGLVGVQANWKDLETWSHLVESSTQNEFGLGLQPEGAAVIAFLGRVPTANRRPPPPTELRVQVAAAYLANPSTVRTKTLTFLADGGTENAIRFDIGASLITDDTSGGTINNGLGRLPAADFVRLGESKTLIGNILGFQVVFRPNQIRAMHAFAERLRLASSTPPAKSSPK